MMPWCGSLRKPSSPTIRGFAQDVEVPIPRVHRTSISKAASSDSGLTGQCQSRSSRKKKRDEQETTLASTETKEIYFGRLEGSLAFFPAVLNVRRHHVHNLR